MIGGFGDRRGAGPLPSDRGVDRRSPAGTGAIADGARLALGAALVNVAVIQPDGAVAVVESAAEPGERYDRALSVARTVMPDLEPTQVRFPVDVNPFVRAVHVDGQSKTAPFHEAAHGTVHAWVARFTTVILGLRWTLSVPLRSRGQVVGSLTAHFARQPADGVRASADEFARAIEATLERART